MPLALTSNHFLNSGVKYRKKPLIKTSTICDLSEIQGNWLINRNDWPWSYIHFWSLRSDLLTFDNLEGWKIRTVRERGREKVESGLHKLHISCLKKFSTHQIDDISCLLAHATRIITSKQPVNIRVESSRKDCAILTPSVLPAMKKAPQDPDHRLLSQLINPHGKQSFQALKDTLRSSVAPNLRRGINSQRVLSVSCYKIRRIN